MAYVGQSVKSLTFMAQNTIEPTESEPLRGYSFISENIGATNDLLATEFGQKLKKKGICYIRCLTDRDAGGQDWKGDKPSGIYNHWQTSFGTEDQKEVERLSTQKGLKVSWGPGRYLKTKYYVSGFEYFEKLDRNILYSSIADHGSWFDTWPGVAELPDIDSFETAHPGQKPLKITFGDDTEMTRDELKTFAKVYDNHGIPLKWKQGDIAVVCNYRFAHGRQDYTLKEGEKRDLGVVLGEMYDRVGEKEGKW